MIKTSRESRPVPFEALPMEHLLLLHERLFAPLDPRSKQRLLSAAACGGAEACWRESDSLAA